MRYFLAAVLALSLLLPPCGSVLAFSGSGDKAVSHHSAHTVSMVSDVHVSEVPMMLKDSVAHPHLADAGVSKCCSVNHAQMVVSENRTTEQIVKKLSLESFLSLRNANSRNYNIFFHNHPPTAPPRLDKQNYSALVGVVKRLD